MSAGLERGAPRSAGAPSYRCRVNICRVNHRLAAACLALLVGFGCSERRPSAVERRLAANAAARAKAEAAMKEPPPPLRLDPKGRPTLLSSLELGMTAVELMAARPKAYESPANPRLLHEELGGGTSAHYTLREDKLYAILVRGSGRSAEQRALSEEATRLFGAPFDFAGAKLHRAGSALLRVGADMGNLILELTDARELGKARSK